jgi:hypothetical protein
LRDPSKTQLLEELERFAAKVNQAQEGALAWVIVSGHGKVMRDGRFHLLVPGPPTGRTDDELSSDDFYAKIDMIHGPVVIQLDTCESGRFHRDVANNRPSAGEGAAEWGRVIVTASDGRATESYELKHSLLCAASLEYLNGRYEPTNPAPHKPDWLATYRPADQPFNLRDFGQYLDRRVEQLNKWRKDTNPDHWVNVRPEPSTLKLTRLPWNSSAPAATSQPSDLSEGAR